MLRQAGEGGRGGEGGALECLACMETRLYHLFRVQSARVGEGVGGEAVLIT